MSNGKAPAWQAREIARNDALEKIKQSIMRMEDEFEDRLNLYRFVQLIAGNKLSGGTRMGFMNVLPGVPLSTLQSIYATLVTVDAAIAIFGRAPEERLALWASLFKWCAEQIIEPHFTALKALEASNPQLIFGAESAIIEVPI